MTETVEPRLDEASTIRMAQAAELQIDVHLAMAGGNVADKLSVLATTFLNVIRRSSRGRELRSFDDIVGQMRETMVAKLKEDAIK